MKKIRLFSTKAIKGIEGEETELYVNFYLVLNKNYIFTFLIDTPILSCSGRNPIKLWKRFLMIMLEDDITYTRRYYNTIFLKCATKEDIEKLERSEDADSN